MEAKRKSWHQSVWQQSLFAQLCLVLCNSAPATSPAAEAVVTQPTAQSHHVIFIVETSRAMQRRAPGVMDAVQGLLDSGLNGQLRSGDTVALWTFNETLNTNAAPPQEWSAATQSAVSARLLDSLKLQPFEKKADLSEVLPPLAHLFHDAPVVTVLFVSSGDGEMQGTPFDDRVNAACKQWRDPQQKARMPLVILLRARHGYVTDWAVYPTQWPIELPTLAPEAQGQVAHSSNPPPAALPPKAQPAATTPKESPSKKIEIVASPAAVKATPHKTQTSLEQPATKAPKYTFSPLPPELSANRVVLSSTSSTNVSKISTSPEPPAKSSVSSAVTAQTAPLVTPVTAPVTVQSPDNSSAGDQVAKFKEFVNHNPNFKEALDKTNVVSLKSLSATVQTPDSSSLASPPAATDLATEPSPLELEIARWPLAFDSTPAVPPSANLPLPEPSGKPSTITDQLVAKASETNLVPQSSGEAIAQATSPQAPVQAAVSAVPSSKETNSTRKSVNGWSEIEVAARTPAAPPEPEPVASSVETNSSPELAVVPPPTAIVESPRAVAGALPEIPARSPAIQSQPVGLTESSHVSPPSGPVEVPSADLAGDPGFFRQNAVFIGIMLLAGLATVVCFLKWRRSLQLPPESVQTHDDSTEPAQPEGELVQSESELAQHEGELAQHESEMVQHESELAQFHSLLEQPENEVQQPASEPALPADELARLERQLWELENGLWQPENEVQQPENEVQQPENGVAQHEHAAEHQEHAAEHHEHEPEHHQEHEAEQIPEHRPASSAAGH
jgi:hypothetical protein